MNPQTKIERLAWLLVLTAGGWFVAFTQCGCVSAQRTDELLKTMTRTAVDTAMDRLPGVLEGVMDKLMESAAGGTIPLNPPLVMGEAGTQSPAVMDPKQLLVAAGVNAVFAGLYLMRKKLLSVKPSSVTEN